MKPSISTLMAVLAGLGGSRLPVDPPSIPYPTRHRPGKRRQQAKPTTGARPAAPWQPNVKGMRYTKAGQVPR